MDETGCVQPDEATEERGQICDRCGWPESDPYETVSRHPTSTGVIVYTRCVCGLLHVRFHPDDTDGRSAAPIARGARPAVPVTLATAGTSGIPDVDDAGCTEPPGDPTADTEGFGPPRVPRQADHRR